jgi:Domain of unknown function (DUF4838)
LQCDSQLNDAAQMANPLTNTYSSVLLLAFLCASIETMADWPISENGTARCVLVEQAGATEAEKAATRELADALRQITGAEFRISNEPQEVRERAIIVGPGPAAGKYFPEVNLATFGAEELVMRIRGDKLLLAGGRPRGTLYAVSRFLQEQCGVRWWTPWATNVPVKPTLQVGELEAREKPAFEYRAPFWYAGFEPIWKVHNCVNDSFSEISKDLGGCIKYKGHAHTFYPLVPPEKYFAEHPEWYSEIKGKRSSNHAQLCLTNPKLRDFMAGRVKEWLRESPDAEIISVTQNDWAGWCECPECKAVDDAEGSHSGTMVAFVNYIAEKIEPEFPNVAVDTFAYQYTRKPPKTIRPRKNVIVRLCSIECNFREPLDHASNAAFMADIEGWSKICSRLYIWDYTTDFGGYLHPHPNWFTLGPNVRVFAKFGVKGVFEQGAYQGYGAEMAELRSWVLAQVLWNPEQDDKTLIRQFLEGYYGNAAAAPIHSYLELMHEASKGVSLRCFLSKETQPYLNFSTLSKAERFWQQAEDASREDSEELVRVRIAHLPVRCAFLRSWSRLRKECADEKAIWPLSESRKAVAEEFRVVAQGVPGKDWTHVGVMSEGGQTVEKFLSGFAEDPIETKKENSKS